jgi:hypothetical protein
VVVHSNRICRSGEAGAINKLHYFKAQYKTKYKRDKYKIRLSASKNIRRSRGAAGWRTAGDRSGERASEGEARGKASAPRRASDDGHEATERSDRAKTGRTQRQPHERPPTGRRGGANCKSRGGRGTEGAADRREACPAPHREPDEYITNGAPGCPTPPSEATGDEGRQRKVKVLQ